MRNILIIFAIFLAGIILLSVIGGSFRTVESFYEDPESGAILPSVEDGAEDDADAMNPENLEAPTPINQRNLLAEQNPDVNAQAIDMAGSDYEKPSDEEREKLLASLGSKKPDEDEDEDEPNASNSIVENFLNGGSCSMCPAKF